MDVDIFIFSVAASVAAAILVIFFQKYWSFLGGWSFFGYPSIEGSFKVTYADDVPYDDRIEINQFGANISGRVIDKSSGQQFFLRGIVTRSRYITYHVKSKDPNINYYGTALLKLNKNASGAQGVLSFIDDDDKPRAFSGTISREDNH